MQITVTKKMNDKLNALLCFSPKKDIRYYLNGVCLDVSGGVLRGVATNGHFLGVTILCEVDAPDGQFIMPREFVERIVKSKGGYELSVAADNLAASHGHSCKPVDGKFPDWRRVVVFPAGEEKPATFNADYLALIAKASRALGNKEGYFKLRQYGTDSAPFQIADDFVGVIMPLRIKAVGTINRAEFLAVTGA